MMFTGRHTPNPTEDATKHLPNSSPPGAMNRAPTFGYNPTPDVRPTDVYDHVPFAARHAMGNGVAVGAQFIATPPVASVHRTR